MADGKVLVEVKNDVKYKKADGTLRMLKNKIVWLQKDESVPKLEINYSDIKGMELRSSMSPFDLTCFPLHCSI